MTNEQLKQEISKQREAIGEMCDSLQAYIDTTKLEAERRQKELHKAIAEFYYRHGVIVEKLELAECAVVGVVEMKAAA